MGFGSIPPSSIGDSVFICFMIQHELSDFPIIRTSRLTIRLPDDADIPEIFRYFRENETHFALTHPQKETEFYTESFWIDRIQRARSEFKNGKSLRLFLFQANKEHAAVGTVNLTEITRGLFQACYVGYDLCGSHEGKGIMTEGLQAVIHYAFSALNLHRIMANYQPHNARSASILNRLGFVIEGSAKDYLFIGGQWKDHVLAALTNHQWKNIGHPSS